MQCGEGLAVMALYVLPCIAETYAAGNESLERTELIYITYLKEVDAEFSLLENRCLFVVLAIFLTHVMGFPQVARTRDCPRPSTTLISFSVHAVTAVLIRRT
jgi:hypothetical protein